MKRRIKNILIIILIIVLGLFIANIVIGKAGLFNNKDILERNQEIRVDGNTHVNEDTTENRSIEENNIETKEQSSSNKEFNEKDISNTEINESMKLQFSDDRIGTLKIPILDVEAEIVEGIDEEILAEYIGHFPNTSLWDGNVALASHNRGSSVVHYFEGIHLLNIGDEIIYITNMGERRYEVYSKKEIDSTDWSVTFETEENIITLITCITGYPEKRLCVQGREI